MNLKNVLIVSHDAGGANLLAYWCKDWEGKVNFIFKVEGPALKIFNKLGLAYSSLKSFPNSSLVDVVITSTGWQSNLEYDAILWANKNKITVSSYLDHWVNYESRFIRSGLKAMPNEIWVGDQDSLTLAKGVFKLTETKIRYIRNRYLARLKRQISHYPVDKKSILICLEPIRNNVSYEDVYERLIRYFLKERFLNMDIIIRDHPSGSSTGLLILKEKLTASFKFRVSDKELSEDLAQASIVVGYQSSVLVYAIYLHLTAISYYPSDKLEPILPHKAIKYI